MKQRQALFTKQNKYRNLKSTFDGITFDSQKEMERYAQLKLLLRAGKIKDLELQKKFILIPTQRIDGKVVERECTYIADFSYFDNEKNKMVVEDTKGFKTEKYIIKRKLMLYVHGIKIVEV